MPAFAIGTNENWRWNGATQSVEFPITVDGRSVVCRISQECIEDNFGNPKGPGACLDAAKDKFEPITDLACKFILAGRFEPDGSILIQSSDWLGKALPAQHPPP